MSEQLPPQPPRELPRGIKNKNPGNIRHSNAHWQGQSEEQTDSDFVTFDDPVYGIRAIMVLLGNYYRNDHIDTVRGAISRYAPANENDTEAYVNGVCQTSGFGPDEVIDPTQPTTANKIACGIVLHENGAPVAGYPQYWYNDETYQNAYALAFPDQGDSV
jgi:hypothetical protein